MPPVRWKGEDVDVDTRRQRIHADGFHRAAREPGHQVEQMRHHVLEHGPMASVGIGHGTRPARRIRDQPCAQGEGLPLQKGRQYRLDRYVGGLQRHRT